MRCPTCFDEYEPAVTRCASCRVDLVEDDEVAGEHRRAPGTAPRPAPSRPAGEVHLGSFHPVMAAAVADLVRDRGIDHQVIERDDEVELRVDHAWRDDLRAELLVRWDELLEELDADAAPDVLATGGHAPGWLDAPVGGHIDRDGRLVVDAPAEDDVDGRRTLGPAMIAGGAILAISGWLVVEVPAVVISGIALVIVGLFLPR